MTKHINLALLALALMAEGVAAAQTTQGPVEFLPASGSGSWFWIDNPGASGNYLRISNGNTPGGAGTVVINGAGNVGIGTTNPYGLLDLANGLGFKFFYYGSDGNTGYVAGIGLNLSNSYNVINNVFGGSSVANSGTATWAVTRGNGDYPYTSYTDLLTIDSRSGNASFTTGNVGIGTAPSYSLDVAGVARAQQGIIYPDGNKQMTAWTGVLCGGDYAEAMNAVGAKKLYEPGDVLVLAADGKGAVKKAQEPYSTLVAGIYATKPGVIGRRESLLKDSDEVPMAMVGVVPTKVSAENGPIRLGDLLVTSSNPGYAMKGTDRSRMLGAVIGKAMGSLETGTGVVEVLVTLQ